MISAALMRKAVSSFSSRMMAASMVTASGESLRS
jgi:hypothetical protein